MTSAGAFLPAQPSATGDLLRAPTRLGLGALVSGAVVLPLLFVPWSQHTFAAPKLTAAVVVTLVGLIAAASVAHRWHPVALVDIPLALWLLALLLATAVSIDPLTSIHGQFPEYDGVLSSGVAIGGFAIGRVVLNGQSMLVWLRAAAVTGAVVALYAVLQAAGIDPVWDSVAGERTFATLGQPNSLAAYLILTTPLTATVVFASKHQTRWAWLMTLQIAGLLTTMSRAGFLAAAVAAVVFVAAVGQRRTMTMRTVAPLAVLVVVGLVAVPGIRTNFSGAASRAVSVVDGDNGSIRQHLALWNVAIAATEARPWLGSGPGLFPDVYAEFSASVLDDADRALLGEFRPESAHSVPLTIMSGSGLPALAVYLAFAAAVLSLGFRSLKHVSAARRTILAGLLAASAGHLTTDLFMTAEVTSTWLFWVSLGAVVALAGDGGRRTKPRPAVAAGSEPSDGRRKTTPDTCGHVFESLDEGGVAAQTRAPLAQTYTCRPIGIAAGSSEPAASRSEIKTTRTHR